ncbi:6-bladed beta-propeller [candidate division KSB1 bacterium]|nr:6-bladed beta-propeller [candidate division KSB1 bacterium]
MRQKTLRLGMKFFTPQHLCKSLLWAWGRYVRKWCRSCEKNQRNSISNRVTSMIRFGTWILLLIIVSCGEQRDTNRSQSTFSFPAGKKWVSFSEIVTPVDTTILEATPNSIVGTISEIKVTPAGLVVADNRYAKKIFLFRPSGEFIRTIGKSGSGPGEYRYITSVQIDSEGRIYVLDNTLNKIIGFDASGQFRQELNYATLGIYPACFCLLENPDIHILFYNPESGLTEISGDAPVILTDLQGDKLTFLRSIGKKEPLLSRLPFSFQAFAYSPNQKTIWLAEIFGLGLAVYTLAGELEREIRDACEVLPEPHIHSRHFEKFNRLSESLDTYYTFTRFRHLIMTKDYVLALYFSPDYRHILIFNHHGDLLLATRDKKDTLPNWFYASEGNDLFSYEHSPETDQALDYLTNPFLIRYRINNDISIP